MKLLLIIPLLLLSFYIKAQSNDDLPPINKIIEIYKTTDPDSINAKFKALGYLLNGFKYVDSINNSVDLSFVRSRQTIYLRLSNTRLRYIYFSIPKQNYLTISMGTLVGNLHYKVSVFPDVEKKIDVNLYTNGTNVGVNLTSQWDDKTSTTLNSAIIGIPIFIVNGLTEMQL